MTSSNSNSVEIRITADGKQAEGTLDNISGKLGGVGDTAVASQSSIAGFAGAFEPLGKAALWANELGELFSAVGGGVGDLARMADQFAGLTGRLQIAVGEGQAFATAFESVRSIANATGSDIDATATLFGRLTTATKELGLSQGQVASLTETIGKSFAISGASAAESASSIRQLGQALASGVLRGDEFNSIMENSPRLAQALADGLGVATGELRKLAEDGKLTAEAVTAALSGQADAIAADFEKMPRTIGRAMQAAQNEFLVFVGELDKAKGVSAGVASAIDGLAKNVDTLGQVALSVGAVAFAGMAAKIASAFAESGIAVRKAIADTQAKSAADLQAAKAAETHAAAEKAGTHATLQAASARQAAAQAALLESQATLKAAADVGVYGAQRAAAERSVTVARLQLTEATVALTAAERANMVATGQLTAAKTAATAQTGLLGTAMKALPLPVNIMLAVASFEGLTASGKALGEGIAKLTPEMRALDAAAAKYKATQEAQARAADDTAHSLSTYKDVAIATAGEISRMADIERLAYEQRLLKAQEYQVAAIQAANAAEAVGKKSAYSAAEAGKALQDLKAGLADFRDQTQVFDSIGASIDAAKDKLLTGFNAALQEAEKKGKGAQDALEKMVKAADFDTPVGINALNAALTEVEKTGKVAGQAIERELRQRIEKLSTEDLNKLAITSQAAFLAMGESAADAGRILDLTLAVSLKKLGVDSQGIATGISKEFSDLSITFNTVAESAKTTGAELAAAFSGLLAKAKTKEEFAQLDVVFSQAKASGKLSADEIARAYGDMAAKVAAAGNQMNSALGDALDRLKIKSVDQVRAMANSVSLDFQKISAAAQEGTVSTAQLGDAFTQYANAAIAANGGVVSSQLKAQAAANGMAVELGKLADANATAEKAAHAHTAAIEQQGKIAELGANVDIRAADAKIRVAQAALQKAKASGDEAAATQATNDLADAEIEKAEAVAKQKQVVADAALAKVAALRAEAEADGMVTQAEALAIAQAQDYANSTYHEAQAAKDAAVAIRDKAAALREEARAAEQAARWATDKDGFSVDKHGKRIEAAGPKWSERLTDADLQNVIDGIGTSMDGMGLGIDPAMAKEEIKRRDDERKKAREAQQRQMAEEQRATEQAATEQQRVAEERQRAAASAPAQVATSFGGLPAPVTQPAAPPQRPAQTVRVTLQAPSGRRTELDVGEYRQAEGLINALRDAGLTTGRG